MIKVALWEKKIHSRIAVGLTTTCPGHWCSRQIYRTPSHSRLVKFSSGCTLPESGESPKERPRCQAHAESHHEAHLDLVETGGAMTCDIATRGRGWHGQVCLKTKGFRSASFKQVWERNSPLVCIKIQSSLKRWKQNRLQACIKIQMGLRTNQAWTVLKLKRAWKHSLWASNRLETETSTHKKASMCQNSNNWSCGLCCNHYAEIGGHSHLRQETEQHVSTVWKKSINFLSLDYLDSSFDPGKNNNKKNKTRAKHVHLILQENAI